MPATSSGRSPVGSASFSCSTPKPTTTVITASTIRSMTRSATIVPSRVRLPALPPSSVVARWSISTTRSTSPARAGSTLLPM